MKYSGVKHMFWSTFPLQWFWKY